MREQIVPPGDTTNPGIRFSMGGAIFGTLEAEHVAMIAAYEFPGIEPYRGWLGSYLERPTELKEILDHRGVTMVTCSNGGQGQSCDFIDPERRSQTIADHLAFARDFLSVFGCKCFKINMGARPPQATTDAELAAIADTLNELGRLTADLGIKLAPHPHIWGPVERPHEIRRIMDLTDPQYVYLTPDTAHLNLGGGDPVELISTYYDRIALVHWKDTKLEYRGYTGPTPTREDHQQEILYKDLGTGGVDLPTVWKMLQQRGYRGWITLDLDPPRPGEGTVEAKVQRNRSYLLDVLKVGSL